jgi:hypothetical protein
VEIPVSGLEHYSNKSFVVRPVIEMCRAQQGFLNGREKKVRSSDRPCPLPDCAVEHVGCRGVVGIVVGWRHIYLTHKSISRDTSTVDTLIWRRDRSSIILNIDKKDKAHQVGGTLVRMVHAVRIGGVNWGSVRRASSRELPSKLLVFERA